MTSLGREIEQPRNHSRIFLKMFSKSQRILRVCADEGMAMMGWTFSGLDERKKESVNIILTQQACHLRSVICIVLMEIRFAVTHGAFRPT